MKWVIIFAQLYATVAHWTCGHRRKYTGERYIVHPKEVYTLMRRYTANPYVLAACWLHDVYEDCGWWGKLMLILFPAEVTVIVLQVSNVSEPGDGNRATRKKADADHFADGSRDAQNLKVADVLANTKSIARDNPKFAPVYLKEKAYLLSKLTKANIELRRRALDQLRHQGRLLGMEHTELSVPGVFA